MHRVRAVVMCVLLVGLLALGDWGRDTKMPAAAASQGSDAETLDERATRLRKRLGRFCRDFDFFYRHNFAGGQMRPVRCSRAGRERTIVVVYAFSSRVTRDAWLNEWGGIAKQRGAPVIEGRRWTAEVLVRTFTKRIHRRLSQ